MLRRTIFCCSESAKNFLFPHGLPKRAFPFREEVLHPQTAPFVSGYFLTKYVIGTPFQFPFIMIFYRSSVVWFVLFVAYDLLWGLPLPFSSEAETGKPHHYFFGNNGGVRHHFWEYQDGWKVPNTSGVRRWVE